MDKFFDHLGDILKSLLSGESSDSARRDGRYADPDMRSAWEELNAFLDDDDFEEPRRRSPDPFADHRREALRQDYANLEVPYGAPFAEVKKAYKRLLRRYHPDRNAGDPEAFRIATEITKKMNVSYRRIRDIEENNP